MCRLVSVKTNYGAEIKVADIKKYFIENIIYAASFCNAIREIILFGSALEERCTEQSDIDIAIVSDRNVSGLSRLKSFEKFMDEVYNCDMSQECDRLFFKSLEEIREKKDQVSVCNELIQKGKVIYRWDAIGTTDIISDCESGFDYGRESGGF